MSNEMIETTLKGFDSSGVTIAAEIDQALAINLWLSVALFASVVAPMLWFAWKYRASNVKNEDIENVTHNTMLEIIWTAVPTAMLMVFFYYGWTSMKAARDIPTEDKNAVTVKVEGSKWKWRYEYPANANGFVHKLGGAYTKPKQDANGKVVERGTMGKSALYVPVDTNIILEMTAPVDDVIHAYFIPAFRIKEDVVPGRTTKQWFKADQVGEYDVECAEYCGTDHSYMYSRLVVMPKDEYNAWINSSDDTPKGNYLKSGDASLQLHGCKTCHSIDTDKDIFGPTLKVRRFTKEQVIDVIENGQKQIWASAMPDLHGLKDNGFSGSSADVEEVASYVAGGMKGTQPASFATCAMCHGEDGKGNYGAAPNLVEYDAPLLRAVLDNGKKGTMGNMPKFPYVSDEEIAEIVKHLNSK
jgi:cytochrome c oxidase subunit II